MIWLTEEQQQAIRMFSAQNATEESCGFVMLDGEVVVVPNLVDPDKRIDRFAIDPADYARLEPHGIVGVWHSHVELDRFSEIDQEAMAADRELAWAVYCLRTDKLYQVDPSGIAPYLNRPFAYGVYDCYSLVSDYLAREHAVRLPPWNRGKFGEWDDAMFKHFDEQWLHYGRKVGKDTPLKSGDILLFNLGNNSGHTDHVGVFTQGGKFLHHLADRLSREDVWGDHWQRRLRLAIRPLKLWKA
jgi:proteasome lid subunit RPN8/RPN11